MDLERCNCFWIQLYEKYSILWKLNEIFIILGMITLILNVIFMIIPVGYTDIVEYCSELLFPKYIVLLFKKAICLLSFRIIFHLVYFSSVKFKTRVSFSPSTPFIYW